MEKTFFGNFNDLKSVEIKNPDMTRQLFFGNDIMVVKNVIPAHTLVPKHSHANEQLFYVLDGECDVEIEGVGKQTLGPSGIAWFPSNVAHAVTVTSDADLVAFDIFTPIREDFLPAFE
ncbi:MAG: cupin domain-containing protein [Oscillospiraceae bacterium]|nr:cupin domain-containing protein [Oscillospiraceae bacterium]